jgi:acetyl-CoA C-acetyltransferase
MEVNQGAAVLVASADAARELAIAADRFVYPWAGADVTEQWFLSERTAIHELAGTRRAAAALFETVGHPIESIDHLDLYSCFPIASRLSAATLGLIPPPTGRSPSPAGYRGSADPATTLWHARDRAAMMTRLRCSAARSASRTGSGWNCTKHALGVWRCRRRAAGSGSTRARSNPGRRPTAPAISRRRADRGSRRRRPRATAPGARRRPSRLTR